MFPGKWESELEQKIFFWRISWKFVKFHDVSLLTENMLGYYQNKISNFLDFFQLGISHKQRGYAEWSILFLNISSPMSV